MKRALFLPLVFSLFSAAAFAESTAVRRDPLETEKTTFSESVLRDLTAKRFRYLDGLAADIRRTRATFDSGAWKLWWFFYAFDASGDAVKGASEKDLEKLIREWISTTGSVTSGLALAKFEFTHVWQDHGESSEKHVAIAVQTVDELERAGQCDIDCLYLTIETKQLGGWSAPLRRVLQTEPTYWHAFALAAYYLLPEWGGSLPELEKFAVQASDATRSKLGDSIYMKAIVATQDSCSCVNRHVDKNRLRNGFDDFQTLFPKSAINLNRFAKFAFESHDRETFRKLMDSPLFDQTQLTERMRRWATEPAPRPSVRSPDKPSVALTQLTTSGRLNYPILSYFESGDRVFGISVSPTPIDAWTLNNQPITDAVSSAHDPSASRVVVFDSKGDLPLHPFPRRIIEPVIRELVTVIACKTSEAGCEPVPIQARVTGTPFLDLELIGAAPFDQAIGAPVIDDRGAILGVVTEMKTDGDGKRSLVAETISLALRATRARRVIGAN